MDWYFTGVPQRTEVGGTDEEKDTSVEYMAK
jgi:hypothetical protein